MGDVIAIKNESQDASSPSKDKLFDPSVDMLVHDFDDERTLEEEEALAAGEDPNDEISSLQKVNTRCSKIYVIKVPVHFVYMLLYIFCYVYLLISQQIELLGLLQAP